MLRLLTTGLLLTAACQGMTIGAPADSDTMLRTDAGSYAARAPLVLTLMNTSTGELGYNLCASELQRWQAGSWVRAPEAQWACTLELRLLQPGASASFTHHLPAGLPAAQYRFVTTIERMGTGVRESAVSNPFAVAN